MKKIFLISLIIIPITLIAGGYYIYTYYYKINDSDYAINRSELIDCEEADETCVTRELSKGHAVRFVKTENIKELGAYETSRKTIEPYKGKYRVGLEVLTYEANKNALLKTQAFSQTFSQDCPDFFKNFRDLENTQAICFTETLKDAINLAQTGINNNNADSYKCRGSLLTGLRSLCVTQMPYNNVSFGKPAVYLYPLETTRVSVSLKLDGYITKSDPIYLNGWTVTAEPNGLIDKKYNYLFYEADVRDFIIPDEGWVVKKEELPVWFDVKLSSLGLIRSEKKEFMDYWILKLNNSPYYEIKLLTDEALKKTMDLNVSPAPDTVIRRMFYFKPLMSYMKIASPNISTPTRKGFTVVEWGGALDDR